ncbi:hypothetical protein HOLleu_34871 [Holothuria leucospilota]|uniref:Uncharacterized protein n=1 Tax=Holothuria leucospilota TaxID=206669 RepID=A0A9Q1BH12_HOLLE|nr:hypothetical protein HOLleu_34871 [Holothuria leucospilota]
MHPNLRLAHVHILGGNEHNVADYVSRGISVEQLKGRWECGPEFLYTPEEEWSLANRPNLLSVEAEDECERRNTQQVFMVKATQIINCENFLNWRRLLRVTVYVFRFVQNLKARCQKSQEPKTQEMRALDPSELKEAETFWIKDAQRLLHTRLKCGSDGKVRNLRVITSTTEFRRPVTKIAVIYPAEGYEDN